MRMSDVCLCVLQYKLGVQALSPSELRERFPVWGASAFNCSYYKYVDCRGLQAFAPA